MKKLLFQANCFAAFRENSTNRSGIYFAAVNLLKELAADGRFSLTLYADHEHYEAVKVFRDSMYPELELITVGDRGLRKAFAAVWDRNREASGLWHRCLRRGSRETFRLLGRLSKRRDGRIFRPYQICFSVSDPFPMAAHRLKSLSYVTVIHDLIPFVMPEGKLPRDYWLFRVLRERQPEDYYVCISECTKRDLLRCCPEIPEAHILVNYNGVSEDFAPTGPEETDRVLPRYGLTRDKYVFSIGNLMPHKNQERQMRAFRQFIEREQLEDIVYAAAGSAAGGALPGSLNGEEKTSPIRFLGYVPDADLNALYSGALFCSFTSLYEGFGFPAAEAMRCGCPLVSSSTSSLPEVCGEAALLVDPQDEEAHVEAYTRLYRDKALRDRLKEKGREQVSRFTWPICAGRLMDFLEEHTHAAT